MITYVYDPNDAPEWGGTYYPVVVCDACGKPIAEHGNAYWLVFETGEIHPQVWHTHKGTCAHYDHVLAEEHGGHVYFEELSRWLGQLRHSFAHLPAPVAGTARKRRCTPKSCGRYVR